MLYYSFLCISVTMFGIQFLFNERYQKESGSGFAPTFMFTLLGSLAGLLLLFIINGFSIDLTPFTFWMAALAAANSILYTFCSLKAFEHINLSLYSIFAMLGGMLLPFLQGILFYEEGFTLSKALCLVLLCVALLLTVEKGERKKGYIYYAGVFVLNGMAGVISKLFTSAPYEKTNEAAYSIWIALISAVLSGIVLLCMLKKVKRPTLKAIGYGAGNGALNKVANYLLLLALASLPASVQYPFITGGTMIVSALISLLCGQRPTKKEILSIALSLAGVLILVFIP